MTDERDPKVSQRYRELPSDEPRRALDRAIIAAAHRAIDRPHAPLVVPGGPHRWYYAIGAVAILVLAVGIALHIESERPDPEAPPAQKRSTTPPQETRDATDAKDKAMEESVPAAKEQPSAPAASVPESAVRSGEMRRSQPVEGAVRSEQAMPAEAPTVSAARVESPDRWVERIVQLRKEGKDDEAERELADFRRRYPDYKLPDAALRSSK